MEPDRLHFLGLKKDVVERELERMSEGRLPGPHAENILRDVGTVDSDPH